ncbi:MULTISPECIES: PLP-dependent aminotransferase family protein [Paenibacillus]|uniref:Transcriptional regulator n=1 Tax=Paenibacillus campinasensis TaxID=66347 RepID=A0A268EPA1_9BACL|nr:MULTISPECIES: PLP-dependent aminotransferase family protein [Paenibacillus]PAD74949.1 transcriptional regulator [Paenibacillus campinasensis]PAK50030.1 transcriptional regulator [Paenibacillus sp. 7541]
MQYSFASRAQTLLTSPLRNIRALAKRDSFISLAEELPAEELFPQHSLAEAAAAVLSQDPRSLQYGEAEGYGPLREWLSQDLGRRKGVHVQPDHILLTTGTQQALDLLVRVYVEPGDPVLIESPTSPGMLQVLRLQGARIIPIEGDEDGLLPDELERQIVEHKPKLLMAAPNFTNPTGVMWSLERRRQVLERCAKHELLIVEDDSYGDLYFADAEGIEARERIPSLFSLEQPQGNHVLYIGSFSKTVAPALRTGWAAGHRRLIEMMTAVKQMADWQSSLLNQRILQHMLDSKHFDLEEHIRMLNREYRTRLKLMIELLKRKQWKHARYAVPEGGMFLWVELPPGLNGDALLRAALLKGVAFLPGSMCSPSEKADGCIRLNFTHPGRDELLLGMNLISEAVTEFTARS